MTPTLHPDSALSGAWHGMPAGPPVDGVSNSTPVEFIIHGDGSVTGIVGSNALTAGRITFGRSWFGRLFHLNSQYRITGLLSNDPFSMPFDDDGISLDGALFLHNRPIRLRLTRLQP